MTQNKYALMAGLASVLLAVLFFVLLWSPKSAAIDETNDETEQVEQQQAQARSTIADLERVRDNEDQLRVELEAAKDVVPFGGPAMSELLDQLQEVADVSGVQMSNFAHARAAQIDFVEAGGTPPTTPPGTELVAHEVQFTITGDYFQVAEFARTMEDPEQVPRGFAWRALNVDAAEHPTLTATVSGTTYAVVPTGGIETEEPTDGPTDGATDADVAASE